MKSSDVSPWRNAFRQAEAELGDVSDGVFISNVAFSPSGDLVVFYGREGSDPRAWVYKPGAFAENPLSTSGLLEFARLSMLGDLIPPADCLDSPRRPDIKGWSRQYKEFKWCGAVH